MKHEKLKRYRMAKGYTQVEFAAILDIDRTYYNQIERGRVTPSMALLEKIAVSLGKSLKDFF